MARHSSSGDPTATSLATIAREWGRIGITGFGGPPAHIALFRKLCVDGHSWLDAHEFDNAISLTNLLPGPASTQLAIFCAWRLRRWRGALVGGACFIGPGLIVIVALAALFLASHPPLWVAGAAAGGGAAVPAVALNAARGLVGPSWQRTGHVTGTRIRWLCYVAAGVLATATLGSLLVLVLIGCGLIELSLRWRETPTSALTLLVAHVAPFVVGGFLALSWVALKVGALSYGGGFVIIPLMQHDVVTTYHWMNGTQFLSAVALGQITPGPVVLTVAVVGYAAGGVGGAALASFVAFAPSFAFIMIGAPHFDRIRSNERWLAFLSGTGAAVIGAIGGSAIPLGRELVHLWQFGVLGLALIWLLVFRRGVVSALVASGVIGVLVVLAGAPR